MAVTFDTLKAATRLREQADFSEKQATALVETFADGIVDNLATREDLKNTEQALRSDLEALRGDLEKTEQGLRADLEKTEQGLRADLDRNVGSLRNEIHKLEHRMTLRLGGVIAAGVAIIVAFDKLF